jgi:restriction system protein
MGELRNRVVAFIADAENLNAKEAEERLLQLLPDLVADEGLTIVPQIRPTGYRTDFEAKRDGTPDRVGIEYKHYSGRPADAAAVDQVASHVLLGSLERALLISKSGFSQAALARAEELDPAHIELVSLAELESWAARIEAATRAGAPQIIALITRMSRDAARIVAEHPDALDALEWRDLERMVAVVLDELGFDAELTPGSKDGGKDVILRFAEGSGKERTFIIELKHWRSKKLVGRDSAASFVQVVAREGHERGLFLSTYGFAQDAFSVLTEIERRRVRFGNADKIVSLCSTFVKAESGLWTPGEEGLPEMLFEDTE